MSTLDYIKHKYALRFRQEMPIKLPISRRHGLLELMNELDFKVGAEIGVAGGLYSRTLLERVNGLKLYCVDPWAPYDGLIESRYPAGNTVKLNECFEKAKRRLKGKNAEIIRKTSMDAVKDFKDENLDFVFIDGNHTFEFAINDIAEWSKKVRPGGMIIGHDYWNSIDMKDKDWSEITNRTERMKLCQAKDAVDAWTKANKIKPWFIVTGDNGYPSWFWVKQ